MKTLELAKDLRLPADEAVTQKYGLIGRSEVAALPVLFLEQS